MTIGGWFTFGIIAIFVIVFGLIGVSCCYTKLGKTISAVIAITCCIGAFFGLHWFFNNTATGKRAMTDERSEIANGLERTVTVYTADGEVIAQYTGRIDIEGNDGGYVLFDFEGKRYTYYNCFVESIAEIE